RVKENLGPPQFFSNEFYRDNCVGFGRGYPGRFNRHINEIYTTRVVHRGFPNPATKRVCGRTGLGRNYSREFPMARVRAGASIKLWYEMDGHYKPFTTFNILGFERPGRQFVTYKDQMQAKKLLVHPFATKGNCHDVNLPNTWCWAHNQLSSRNKLPD
ncbi:hypothetical protein L0F63_006553, partial [Massospora cicadina]